MGSEANFASTSIPKFDSDYDHWSMVLEEMKLKDLKAKNYLF